MKSKSTLSKIHLQGDKGKKLLNHANTTPFTIISIARVNMVTLGLVLSMFLLNTTLISAQILQRGSEVTAVGTTSVVITKPSGLATGDVMIANIAHVQSTGTATDATSSGWTVIDGAQLGSSTRRHGTVLYKVATASEPASYTFTTTSATSAAGSIVTFSGVDVAGATPFDVAPGTISVSANTSSTSVAASSTTTASANAAVIMFGQGIGNASVGTNWTTWATETSPGTLTEISDYGDAGTTTAFVGAAWAIKSAAGITGAGSAAVISSGNGGILIALKPAATAAGNYYIRTGGTNSDNLHLTASWTNSSTGTGGTSPTNFTTANQVFNIGYNGISTAAVGASWTVSGTGSKIVVGNGTNACNFTVGSNYVLTAPVDIMANGTLTLSTSGSLTGITLGTLQTNSTVNYAGGAQTMISATYSNLIVSGTGSKTTAVTVNEKLSMQGTTATIGNTITYGPNAILEYKGSAAQTTSNNEFPNTMSTDVIIDNNNGTGVTVNAAKASTGSLTITSGSLNLNGLSHSFGSLTGGGVITSGVSGTITLTVGGDGTSTTYTGVIQNGSGTVSLTKTGSGALILSGTNTYSGTTTVSAGILRLGAAGSGANGPLGTTAGITSVTGGAALDLNGFTLATAEPLTLNGTGISNGGALMNSGASATYSGLITLGSASSIAGGTGPILITHSGTITGATFGLTLGGAQGGTLASILGTTTGTLTKADAGTWILTRANTYTGTTTVTAGELRLNPSGDFTQTTQIVLNGGKLSTTGIAGSRAITFSTLNLNANSSLDLGANAHTLTFANSSAVSWAGTALTINGWTGTAGGTGSAGKIYFGAGGLIAGQLSHISFAGYSGAPATLITLGELVPSNVSPSLGVTGTTDHGSSCVLVAAAPRTYLITNTGGIATGVSVTSLSTQFVVSNLSSTTIAGSGGTATFVVTFTPGTVGAKSADIIVSCSTPGVTTTVTMTGTGITATAGLTSSDPDNTICAGTSVTFTATGGGTYEFFINGSTQLGPSSTATFTTSALTDGQIVTVRVVNTNGCIATSTGITTTVNPLPPIAPITGYWLISIGTMTQLGNPVGGGAWSSGTPAVATVDPATGLVTGVTPGTSLITYTVTNGTCTNTATFLVTVSATVGIEDIIDKNGLTLRNHPNPFIGNTTISYVLPSDGRVTLTIRNTAGQVVKTIVNEMETKGNYTVSIDAADLQSGVYFVSLSLKTNGKVLLKTIRMVKGN